jgi:putative DNA primase/helicase
MTASGLPVRTTVITGEATISIENLGHRLGLKQYQRSWRGACPSCAYPGAFVASDGKRGTLLWCANGCNQKQLSEAISRISRGSWEPPLRQVDPAQSAEVSKRKQAAALKLWNGAILLKGTPGELYLRGRGLPFLITSSALRYRPDCPHPEGWRLPTLIAVVTGPDGQPTGIHRTFIDSWGSTAKIEPSKASLGPIWGGAIRLDEPVVPELVIGEGIESTASAGKLLGLPAWAAITAGNLTAGLVLPEAVRSIVIAADNDAPLPDGKRPGQDAARAAWFRWRGEGRAVRIATPDREGSDFNDILLARLARESSHG